MGSFKLFGTELKSLKERKGLLIALIGVMLIPIVYVAVLLSATWGPYDNLENLPVAFVNKDEGGVSSGNPINVGNDLMETLKESKTLGWNFVSEEEAYKGLESNKYYMVIEIPEDFSQKVTTVLDPNPTVPELRYVQNEGLNFMASQVTNSAVERLREQLGDKITATYARTVFAQIGTMGQGFADGADGSNQIYEGSTQLAEGTNTLLTSLEEKAPDIERLAEGAQTADAGAGTLLAAVQNGTKGVNDLASGSAQVATGAGSLKDGANQLLAGTKTAQAGSQALASGIEQKVLPGAQQIAGGLQQLNDNAPALTQGAAQIASGAGQVVDALQTQITPGAAQLSAGVDAAVAGIGQLAPGASELSTGVGTAVDGINRLYPGSAALSMGVDRAVAGINQLYPGAASLSLGINELSAAVSTQITPGANKLKAGVDEVAVGVNTIAAVAPSIETGTVSALNGVVASKQLTASLVGFLDNNEAYKQIPEISSLYDNAVLLDKNLQLIIDGTNPSETSPGLRAGVTALKDGALKLQAGINHPTEGLVIGATTLAGGLNLISSEKLPLIADGATQVAGGLGQLYDNAPALSSGAAQVSGGLGQLYDNGEKLKNGAAQVAGGLGQLQTNAPTLQNGAKTLAEGLNTLTTSAAPLKPGAQQLNEGIQQVAGGVAQLAPGAAQLAQGLQTEVLPGAKSLSEGLNTIAAGQATLANGAGTLQSGASQVAAGNSQLKGSWGTLSNGVTELKAGLSQIADGNQTVATGWGTMTEGVTQLNDGTQKLQAGSKELATGLQGGADTVGALQVSDNNINMFASPVTLAGDKVNQYTYYRDSTAPYILSLALFVGMLVLSFFVDFKKPAVLPGSAISWFVSKWLQLALFATIQAVLVTLFTLVVLRLDVQNVVPFILFAIFVSITFMSIVFFLVSAGGNIGRFIALAFIVLQLSITGSNLPIPMLPENLRALSQFLPLTYSNAGFKSVISLGDLSLLSANVSILAIYLVITSALALVAFIVSYKTLTSAYKPAIESEV
jgi:putative membrane protein